MFSYVTERRLLTKYASEICGCPGCGSDGYYHFGCVAFGLAEIKPTSQKTCYLRPLDSLFFPEVWCNRITWKISIFDQITRRHIEGGCDLDSTLRVLSKHLSSARPSNTIAVQDKSVDVCVLDTPVASDGIRCYNKN
jgi:hypothetical protein